MCSRHQELHGADSAEAWDPKPFLVLMEARWEEGDRIKVRIPAAIGPRDAKGQASYLRPEYVALTAEELIDDRGLDEWDYTNRAAGHEHWDDS